MRHIINAFVVLHFAILSTSINSFLVRHHSSLRLYSRIFSDLNINDEISKIVKSVLSSNESIEISDINLESLTENIVNDGESLRDRALYIMDCLTSPKDEKSADYDLEKDLKRDEIMLNTDYELLKVDLKRRGLRQNGDKLEMMIRLLLHVIDPSVLYSESTGQEVNLKYIEKEDLAKVKIIPEDERQSDYDEGPDADDLRALKSRRIIKASEDNETNSTRKGDTVIRPRNDGKRKIIMDGLVRKEVSFPPCRVFRDQAVSKYQDRDITIRGYVVGGRDVLKTWDKFSSVVVMLPDKQGWRNKNMRVVADEIAFYQQSVVLIPDIYRGYVDDEVENQVNKYQARILDDIVATLLFAKTEYNTKSLSLAGIGFGGQLSVQIATDLGNIAALEEISRQSASTSRRVSRIDAWSLNHPRLHLPYNSDEDHNTDIPAEPKDSTAESSKQESIDKSGQEAFKQRCAERGEAVLRGKYPSISLTELSQLCPLVVAAFTPKEIKSNLSSTIRIPLFIVTTGDESNKTSVFNQCDTFCEQLTKRSNEILDFSFRSYSLSNSNFIDDPQSDDDIKCSKEAVLLGSYWMDIYSRLSIDDYVDGLGKTKTRTPFMIVSADDIRDIEIQDSPVATYLHDEPYLFENRNLPSDTQIKNLSV